LRLLTQREYKPPRKTPSKGKQSTSTSASKSRRSKLAKENDISAEEEDEIKEAWNLFRIDGAEEYEDEKEGVIRTSDVQQVLK
jgi:phosphoenolpyruvate carboxylase